MAWVWHGCSWVWHGSGMGRAWAQHGPGMGVTLCAIMRHNEAWARMGAAGNIISPGFGDIPPG